MWQPFTVSKVGVLGSLFLIAPTRQNFVLPGAKFLHDFPQLPKSETNALVKSKFFGSFLFQRTNMVGTGDIMSF